MSSTTTSKHLTDCPVCDKPISATLSIELATGEPRGKELPVKATVTGMRVEHDCIPMVTR